MSSSSQRIGHYVLVVILLFTLLTVDAKSQVSLSDHELKQSGASCMESCLARLSRTPTTHKKSSRTTTNNNNAKRLLSSLKNHCQSLCTRHQLSRVIGGGGSGVSTTEKNQKQKTQEALSDASNGALNQQEQATTQLWELFHKNLRSMLSNSASSADKPGLQLVEPTIELTDIRSQIAGWESMPAQILAKQYAQDYDNAQVFSAEFVRSSYPGYFRDTSAGISFIDQYKKFLSGVSGVTSAMNQLPDPSQLVSVQLTQAFEAAMNSCYDRYMSASPMILARFDMDQFRVAMCPDVARAENAMYAQIGREQILYGGGNSAYGAAVALGMAQTMFTGMNSFTKLTSLRAMEQECILAQEENRPLNGQTKSMSFQYDYHTWQATMETVRWQTTKRKFIFKKKVNHEQTTVNTVDLTDLGGVEIAFADFKYIPLFAGEWYSSSAIRDFRYMPREANSPIGEFFGTDMSTLSLMPTGIYVAVNPTISFWVESSKKETFKQETRQSSSSGLRIFGFGFGSSSSKHTIVEEGNTVNGKTKITIAAQNCHPQLFAVDNAYNY